MTRPSTDALSVKPVIVLAPMEGLVDPPMRDILTRIGGIDWCVSEFIRVTTGLLNRGSIQRIVPELSHDWKTRTCGGWARTLRCWPAWARRRSI